MSQELVNFAVPTGLNWNEQSPGSAVTDDLRRLLRLVERRVGVLGEHLEQREVGQRRDAGSRPG